MTDKLNLTDALQNDPKFSTLSKALEDAGLVETLSAAGPFTILAPTNEAFAKISEEAMTDLRKPENKSKFAEILKYHVIEGKVTSEDLAKLSTSKTIQGQEIKIDATDGIKINGSNLRARNMNASNGVFHAIDSVLTPAAAATQG
ncbi:MAG TPA: fasciclin domain-containing protein [Aridibacter sp.]|nr:fasciclin domain-containing protein [Aridibacter sp.]